MSTPRLGAWRLTARGPLNYARAVVMRSLKVTSGPDEGQTLEIEGELVVGREGADLILHDPELSRRHAVLREVDRGVEIEDLGSLNGTFVNGERIASPVTLTSSGSLKLGTTEMAVEVDIPPPAPAPDVTAPRAIPEGLDVTAERPVPPVDVTAVRQQPPAPPPPAGEPLAPPTDQPPAPPTGQPPPPPGPMGQPPPPAAPDMPPGGPPAGMPPGGPPAGMPPGGPPGGMPPGGPPAGLPPLPAPMRILVPRLARFAAGRWLMGRLFRLPARARVPVLLLLVLLVIGLPVAAVVLLVL